MKPEPGDQGGNQPQKWVEPETHEQRRRAKARETLGGSEARASHGEAPVPPVRSRAGWFYLIYAVTMVIVLILVLWIVVPWYQQMIQGVENGP